MIKRITASRCRLTKLFTKLLQVSVWIKARLKLNNPPSLKLWLVKRIKSPEDSGLALPSCMIEERSRQNRYESKLTF